MLPSQVAEASRIIQERAEPLWDLVASDPAQALSLALPADVAANLRYAGTESKLEAAGEWTGTLEEVTFDDFTLGRGSTLWRLRSPEQTHEIYLASPASIRAGRLVKVKGIAVANRIAAAEIVEQPQPAAAAQDCKTVGPQNIAVLLVTYPSYPSLPVGYSPDNVRQAFFGGSPGEKAYESLNGIWQEMSYGRASATGEVYGPFPLKQDFLCDRNGAPLLAAAIEAAESTVDFSRFTRVVVIFPAGAGCPPNTSGWSSLGCTATRIPGKGDLSMSQMWLPVPSDSFPDVGLIAHEMGHGLGVHHSSTIDFGSIPLGPVNTTGALVEYGDNFSIMGSPSVADLTTRPGGHYPAKLKSILKWLEPGPDGYLEVTASGSYMLAPFESSGLRALRVARNPQLGSWLWVEYRQPIGDVETSLGYLKASNVFQGAQIRLEDSALSDKYTYLLDFHPTATPNNFRDGALTPGQTWTDPYSRLSLRVNSATPEGLSIDVTYDEACAKLEYSSAVFGPGGGSGTIQVKAPASCSWDAKGSAEWMTVSPSSGQGDGTVTFTISANETKLTRTGSITVERQGLAITQTGTSVAVIAATPVSFTGTSGQFKFRIFDQKGAGDISYFGLGYNPMRGCFINMNPKTGHIRMANIASSFLLGTPGASLTDGYCTVYNEGSSIVGAGNIMEITLQIDFAPAFAGSQEIMGYAAGTVPGDESGWPRLATWTIQALTPRASPLGYAFPASGGAGTIQVTTESDSSWAAVSRIPWAAFDGPASGSGSGRISFKVGPNTGAHRSGTISAAGQSIAVEQAGGSDAGLSPAGFMPHFAAGGGWKTTFTMVNTGSTAAQARLGFYDDTGQLPTLPIGFPMSESATPVNAIGALERTIAPRSVLSFESTGSAADQTKGGWVRLLSTGKVSGFGVFLSEAEGQEAVVPLETRNSATYYLPFDNTNRYLNGVALANTNGQSVAVAVTVRDGAGKTVEADTIQLDPSGHTAFIPSDRYPEAAGARGTLQFTTPMAGQIGVLGLRFSPTFAFTSVPALIPTPLGGGTPTLSGAGSMTHIASGGGWRTTFTLVNTGAVASRARLDFFDTNGAPLTLPLTLTQGGVSSSANAAFIDHMVQPGATLTIETEGPAAQIVKTGSAQLQTTGDISGFSVFRSSDTGQEAVTPLENRGAASYVLPFDNTKGYANGIAVANNTGQSVSIAVTIRDTVGVMVGTVNSLTLPAHGQKSFLLSGEFPAAGGLAGSLEFVTPSAGQISVLGLRFSPKGAFTSIPAALN